MKSKLYLPTVLLILALLAACALAAPERPTVTFENDQCTYTGPQPIPTGTAVAVDWIVKNKDRTKYGLYVFTLEDGKTKEDLLAAADDPAPPAWAPIAGLAESTPDSTAQVTIDASVGPLYFTCWFSPPDTMFQVIGPIEVK